MSINGTLQLTRVIVRYCKSSGSSDGVRGYLKGGLAPFAASHPTITFSVTDAPMRPPYIRGEWLDGTSKVIDVKNRDAGYVGEVLEGLRDAASGARRNLRKPVTTGSPSVQGVWDPSITYEGFSMRDAKVKDLQ